MLLIVGYVIILLASVGTYAVHGSLAALFVPLEYLAIVGLTIGGWLQGVAMLDAARPFIESVTLTMPYLKWRSVGGTLMLASHVVFVGHFLAMALRFGPSRAGAALFWQQGQQEVAHEK